MKINRLSIHNLASIKDATIDFNGDPLKNADVFLISGETGAGKSTILDAICLSLYKNTPRLKNTKMTGETSDSKAGKSLKADDPRLLMRHNTGDACTILDFTGNDCHEYTAEWSVARARKKTDGKVQSVKWVLTDHDTAEILTKDNDIKERINTVVGLDFDQFCRTTMLAQGDFTKFLNSNDGEKAAILEKITGATVYKQVGARIYELYKRKETEYREINATYNTASQGLIGEERILDLKSRQEEISMNLKTTHKRIQDNDTKLKWICDNERNRTALEESRQRIKEIEANLESEEIAEERLLAGQWEAIRELRGIRKEIRKGMKIQENLGMDLKKAAERFRNTGARVALISEMKKRSAEREQAVKTMLEEMRPIATLLEDYGKWETRIEGIIVLKAKTAGTEREIAILEKNIGEKEKPEYEKAEEECAVAGKALAKLEDEYKRLKGKLAKENLPEKRENKETLIRECHSISQLEERIADVSRKAEERKRAEEKIQSLITTIDNKKKEYNQTAQCRSKKSEEKERARHEYEIGSKSIDEFAVRLRTELQAGDVCPICGRKILEKIKEDSMLPESVRKLKDKYEIFNKEYDELNAKEKRLAGSISSDETRLADEKKKLAENNEIEKCWENVREQAAHLELYTAGNYSGECAATLLQESLKIKGRKEKELHTLESSIKNGDELERIAAEAEVNLEKGRKLQDSKRIARELKEKAYNQSTTKITNLKTLLANIKGELDTELAALDTELSALMPDYDWHENPERFRIEIHTKAKLYRSLSEEQNQLEDRINLATSAIRHFKKALDSLDESITLPDGDNTIAVDDNRMENVMGKDAIDICINDIITVQTSVTSIRDRMADNTLVIQNREKECRAFLLCHPEYTEERIRQLEAIDESQIRNLKEKHDILAKNLAAECGKETLLKQQGESLEKIRPTFKEEETKESIQKETADLTNEMNDLNKEYGEISSLLKRDSEDRSKLEDIILKKNECEREYKDWNELNTLFGDSNGTKFSKIALSYILSNLVELANNYMRLLSDRYRLVCTPGSYLIQIEDRYQGYSRRSTSTISGGESFLVSLALALGLGDMGEGVAADTIFIDEGFGSLSGEPLNRAIDTLRTLQTKTGKHVGIISHVPELRERIPVQIHVEREAGNPEATIRIQG